MKPKSVFQLLSVISPFLSLYKNKFILSSPLPILGANYLMAPGPLVAGLTICRGSARPVSWRHAVGRHAIFFHSVFHILSLDLSDTPPHNGISPAWLLFLATGLSMGLLECDLRRRKATPQGIWSVWFKQGGFPGLFTDVIGSLLVDLVTFYGTILKVV